MKFELKLAFLVATHVVWVGFTAQAVAMSMEWNTPLVPLVTGLATIPFVIVTARALRRLEANEPVQSGKAHPLAVAGMLVAAVLLLHGVATLVSSVRNPEERYVRWAEAGVEHELRTQRRPWESPAEQRRRLAESFIQEQ